MICLLCFTLFACNNDKCKEGHTWELSSTTATCYDGGVETYTCKVCKGTKTEDVDAYGHDYVLTSRTDPTCKTNGEEVKKCSRCGFESKQTLLIIDHDYQVKSTTPSTCIAHGVKLFECSMCHGSYSEQLPLLNHNYKLVEEIPSTCTVCGSKTFECQDCTDSYSESLPLLKHNYELIDTTPSTCVIKGSKNYECAVCHDTYSDELPLVDHDYQPINVLSTCFTHGATKEQCSVCSDEKNVQETPLLTHSFGPDGYCEHCGIYETLFDIDKLNVTWIKGNDFGQIEGNLVTKFKESNNTLPDSYWKDHIVTLTITMYDKGEQELEKHDFQSTTLPFEGANHGKLTIQYVRANGELGDFKANQFLIFPDEGNIFSKDSRQNCTSFKIELSCEGYKTIEKTYFITAQ